VGTRDLGEAKEGPGGLDHRDQPRRPRCHAAFRFDFVDDLGDEPHMLGAVGLWQRQRQHPRSDRSLDIAHRKAQRPVGADYDIGPAARDDHDRLRHQGARPFFLGGGDAVLEIEDNRIGAAPGGPVEKAAPGYRDK